MCLFCLRDLLTLSLWLAFDCIDCIDYTTANGKAVQPGTSPSLQPPYIAKKRIFYCH